MPYINAIRTTLFTLTVLLSVIVTIAFPVGAEMMREIRYLSWEGSRWTAQESGSRFEHSPEHTNQNYVDSTIRYKGWDGGNFAARLDMDRFLIAPEGDFSSGRARHRSYLTLRSWDNRTWTAKWHPGERKFELNRPIGVMLVAETSSVRLNNFRDLNSSNSICVSKYSMVPLKEYVQQFELTPPRYIQIPVSEYYPALERGLCQAAVTFATREDAWAFSNKIASRGNFKLIEVP